MKWLVIAVIILAQQPAKPPESKGSPESKSAQVSNQTDRGESHNQPAAQSGSRAADNQHPAANLSTSTTHPNSDAQIQGMLVTFTGLLVVVGFLQFAALIGQVVIYCRQANIMVHQARESTRQRITMRKQWTTMQGQLAQMESSGRQTAALIAQARRQTRVALTNAKNALQHTKILAHAERPWVLVDESVVLPTGANAVRRGHIFFNAKNWGKNPAKITRHSCDFSYWEYRQEVPDEPEYHQTELKYPQYLVRGADPIDIYDFDCDSAMTTDIWDDVGRRKQRLVFIGHVVYVDLATGEEHETRFCYAYTPYGTLILIGPRSYNQNT
jgi:hypothetical protein